MTEDNRWSKWFNQKMPFFEEDFLGINETFKQMEEAIAKEFEELSKRAPTDLQHEETLPDGTKVQSYGPFVYGYSVTVGPDGKPNVKEFGNFKAGTQLGKPHMDIKEKREPLTDIIDANENVRIIIELPGVEKDDIKLAGTDNKLTISVDTAKHKYYKEIEMPSKIDAKKAKSNYKNGVLDITVPKKKPEKTKSQPIKID
ncbi:MAG: Hsp20/alpha crystallin family protein [Candidatus Bathyarchaeota archaeon]|nr:Hsp20/alpha crystallin family protein [Candidatus Bathyarchaeum tardum]WGM89745.1 MAG: Hsp20/alpha crystallin family protein [Candidatus Bathyarchaeum tardum]WNZ30159.1 MAG: Hsp20/alpha crystallin family protein [Candidatus Bathyarchaeota archaeon]